MNITRTKVRRAATKGLSVGLSATTTLWLVGSSVFMAVPAAHASNDAVVADITSSNPRIAPNGESELAVLGVNIAMDANPQGVDKRLQSVAVQLKSDDAAGNGEAALSDLEVGRIYSDSGLSGTGGQFDSQDPLVATATRAVAGAYTALVTDNANAAAGSGSVDTNTQANAPADNAAVTVKLGSGLTAEVRAAVYQADDNAAADACATGVGANTCLTLGAVTTFGHSVAGQGAASAAIIAKKTQIVNGDISNSGNVAGAQDGFTTFAAAGTGALHTGYEEAAIWGDTTADADADVLNYTPPTTDTGNDAGNDLFVTFLTSGGVANQTFVAAIWPDENAAERVRIQLHDILLDNLGGGGNIAVNSNTTNNESKTITLGSDNVAPSIQSVSTIDNDADGNVDRVEVKFNESMGTAVNATTNFVTAIGDVAAGNRSAIASVPASNDDADLAATGTWMTGTVLNDTLRIDFQGDNQSANCAVAEADPVGTYCNATASTGDTFQAVYDRDNAGVLNDNLTDATGTPLEDVTVSTTDKARPVFMTQAEALPGTVQVRDANGNGKIDEIRLTGSESWSAASTSSGLVLRRTDVNPNVIYTLGAVSGFLTSAGTAVANGNANTSNANDIVRVAVTEQGGTDVTGVFTLDYTAASTLKDNSPAGNEARSVTGLASAAGIAPVVQQAWIADTDNVAAGAPAFDGVADNDGQIDALVVIFNSNVEVDETGGNRVSADMALSGGYAFQAGVAPIDDDNDQLLMFPIVQSGVSDTDLTPDWTYTNDGQGAADGGLCASPGVGGVCDDPTDNLMESVTSSTVTEQNKAGAVLLNSNLYENASSANDIWEAGETLVMTFSENIDPSSFRTSYVNDALLNGPADFGWANVNAAEMPDGVNVNASGRVVTLTAVTSGTEAWDGNETIMVGVHEILDTQGNFSPDPVTGAGMVPGFGVVEQSLAAAVAVNLTPAVAPAVLRIDTRDGNNNGILDSFVVSFGGLINPASITLSDFAAARGANFNVDILGQAAPCGGGAAGDNWACATTDVVPDLTITSVATMNGGNDSQLLVNYSEVGENTGAHPQLKYVQGSLADLAANKIATFNAAASTNTKLDLNITNGAGDFPSRDNVAPKAMYKLLKDRDLDKMIDQLVIVLSETMLNGLTPATTANANLTSSGWVVTGKTIAANGATINNTDYQAYTFATASNVWQVDVTEGTTQDTTIPGVSYTSSGNFRDTGGNILGAVAAGGEATNITGAVVASTVADGNLFQGNGPEVWIAKKIGSKFFRRHVLNANFDTFYPHLAPFWSHVLTGKQADVTASSMSAWIRLAGDTKVYEVNGDSTKHWISCADDSVAGQDCANEWSSSGRDADGIYTVNSAEFNSYTTGPTVIMPDVAN